MTTFKLKPEKIRYVTEIRTLDETHQNIISEFQKRKKMLPQKRKKLERYQQQLERLEKKNPSKYTNKDIRSRSKLKTDIQSLKDDIYDIENNISETDYYTKTYDLLLDYYDILDNNDDDFYEEHPELSEQKVDNHIEEEKDLDQLDLLNLKNKKKRIVKKTTRRRKKRMEPKNQNHIMDFFGAPTSTGDENQECCNDRLNRLKDRSQLHKEFRMLVDNEYQSKDRRTSFIRECSNCGVNKMLIQAEGIFVCRDCGEVEMIIIESERGSYNESIPDKPGYPYKRINHYSEWLSQFQAKESTEIPKEVYDQILTELHKNRIHNLKTLTSKKIKEVLKRLGLTSYYEHAPHIVSKLSGLPPPTISRETEERLRKMFKQIQEPFEKHCPKHRINFLSYSYVLHKFCELLELDDFIKCFPLLKSREKLREQDKIWKKICKEVRWQYIPSI